MSVLLADLNALASDNFVGILLEFVIPGSDTLRICANNEDITFNGFTYSPFPIDIQQMSTAGKGENPTLELQVDNTTRVMESYLQQYDYYLKVNGVTTSKIEVTLYVVNTADLSEAIYTEYWEVSSWKTNAQWAIMTLGAKSPLTMRYPRGRILQNFCRWKFKSVQCGYSGSATECNKTLARCRELNNSGRIGAFPGVGKGIRI